MTRHLYKLSFIYSNVINITGSDNLVYKLKEESECASLEKI